jgi:hypothetical protein
MNTPTDRLRTHILEAIRSYPNVELADINPIPGCLRHEVCLEHRHREGACQVWMELDATESLSAPNGELIHPLVKSKIDAHLATH